MVKSSSLKAIALSVVIPLALGAIGLTVLRAPGATVEGYGAALGTSAQAPGEEFKRALADFTVAVGGQNFTAAELGVGAKRLPSIPRAWSFDDWNRDYHVELQVDTERRDATLGALEDYGAPVEGSLSYDGASWISTAGAPGLQLSEDLSSAVAEAIAAGKDSLELELKEVQPKVSGEDLQLAADALNGAAVKILGGSTELAILDGAELASLFSVAPKAEGLSIEPNGEAVAQLAEKYSSMGQEKVDGEQVVGDDGTVLKTITAPRDGFVPGSTEEISEALKTSLSELLETPAAEIALPGQVDPAEPKLLKRSAVVDVSDHYAYFYENDVEVARFPVAVGKPGYETDRGTFKVYAQLTSQHMGSCDAAGNYVPGGGFDYCTANVPWISYFNGDEGFHGTYWHSNFGNDSANMSHGCVNMTVADAEWTYRFLQVGSTVTVRD